MAVATSTALLIAAGVASAATVGTSAYSADQEKKAQKKTLEFQATENQKALDFQTAQVKAAEDKAAAAEELATQEAKDKLKKQRLSQTQTILTSPLGVTDNANLGLSTLLGGK